MDNNIKKNVFVGINVSPFCTVGINISNQLYVSKNKTIP